MKIIQMKIFSNSNFRTRLSVFLLFIITSVFYSQTTSIQNISGVNIVSLNSSSGIVSQIPQSYPNNINSTSESFSRDSKGTFSDDNFFLFNWVLKFTAGNKVFKDISFANTQVGYIVTELGAVYKSTNGGDNWVSVMNLGFPYYWYGVHALSVDTVVIAGFNNQGQISTGVVRWSFNGGTTWINDIVLRRQGAGVGWLDKVHFFNQNTGIVFNALSGACHYTTTGGKDTTAWTFVTINSDGGWIAGNIDAQNTGIVYATGIHFAKSTNFGSTWVSGPSADGVFDGGVDFLDNNNLFGWTGGGQISAPVSGWTHRTTDGGSTWGSRQNTFPYPIRGVYFFNENTGFAIGGNLYQEAGGIYSTTNGGTNWILEVNTAAEMFSLTYKSLSPDSMDVWCVGSTGGGSGYTGKLYMARMQNLVGIKIVNTEIPESFKLYQNYPNPFNPVTNISYELRITSYAKLSVYDIQGKHVTDLVNQKQNAVIYEVDFSGSEFA